MRNAVLMVFRISVFHCTFAAETVNPIINFLNFHNNAIVKLYVKWVDLW